MALVHVGHGIEVGVEFVPVDRLFELGEVAAGQRGELEGDLDRAVVFGSLVVRVLQDFAGEYADLLVQRVLGRITARPLATAVGPGEPPTLCHAETTPVSSSKDSPVSVRLYAIPR